MNGDTYQILREQVLIHLTMRVNAAMAEGWKCQGSVVRNDAGNEWMQVMTRAPELGEVRLKEPKRR